MIARYKSKKISGAHYLTSIPIEYKKVDVDDFIEKGYSAKKIMLDVDDSGYAVKSIVDAIDIKKPSTDIINVTTGCGKTTAIYKLIKKINDDVKNAIIIVATPYISLVDKDFDDLVNEYGIHSDLITKYSDLTKDVSSDQKYSTNAVIDKYIIKKKIHITTINALLRNPGDTAFEQRSVKASYFTNLIDYCINNEKKVYLFLDEIHASIHNFKDEYIYYLTMWKGVMHKCIVSTATYTESVNIVVKHLAYLTKDIINVYETDRLKKKKLASLDLCFFPDIYTKSKVDNLVYFLNEYLDEHLQDVNNFHILSYSRKLAKEIYDAYVKTKNVLLLTSKTKDKFTNGNNHIGTSFCTGINIEKEGDILIILFPWKYSDENVKGEEGIFYDGLPSILQAVARLRKGGRILMIIPPMKTIIDDDQVVSLAKYVYPNKEIYPDKEIKKVKEDFLKDEKKLLDSYINRMNKRIEDEYKRYIGDIKNGGVTRPGIQSLTLDTFILERGQEFIKYRSYKSGKQITPYVVWAALKDQFVNCRLENIILIKRLTKKMELPMLSEYIERCYEYELPFSDFNEYYKDVKLKLSSTNENNESKKIIIIDKNKKPRKSKNTEDKGKKQTNKVSLTSVGIFWQIVDAYFKGQTESPIKNIHSYYEFCFYNRSDQIASHYKALNKILRQISGHIGGEPKQEKELLMNPLITQFEYKIKDIISLIKMRDPVVKKLLETKNAFWNLKENDQFPYTRYLLQNLFAKDKRRSDGSYNYVLKM